MKQIRNNNSGYSLVELICIIGIICSLVVVVSMNVGIAYKARSKEAITKIESLASESKVNALSGKYNKMVIKFDKDNDCYIASLFHKVKGELNTYESEPYETVLIGNKHLDISCGGTSLLTEDTEFEMIFKSGTGAVKSAVVNEEPIIPGDGIIKITATYGRTYLLQIYDATGALIVTRQGD